MTNPFQVLVHDSANGEHPIEQFLNTIDIPLVQYKKEDETLKLEDFHLLLTYVKDVNDVMNVSSVFNRFVEMNRGVMILNVTKEVSDTLLHYFGFSPGGECKAYFLLKKVDGTFITETFSETSVTGDSKGAMDNDKAIFKTEDEMAAKVFVESALEVILRQMTPILMQVNQANETDDSIKGFVKKFTFNRHFKSSAAVDYYDKKNTFINEFEIKVTVALNNPKEGEQYQFIIVEADGFLNPGTPFKDYILSRGWMMYKSQLSLKLTDSNHNPIDHQLVLVASAPDNENKEHETEDTIGFEISSDGAKASYQKTIKNTIKDWEVRATKMTSHYTEWNFGCQWPINGIDGWVLGPFHWPLSLVCEFPQLCKNTFKPQVVAVWRTKSIMKEKVILHVGNETNYMWPYIFVSAPNMDLKTVYGGERIEIDLSKVLE
ncbi:hypothetical protein [Neobacillus kokaensis]|uniref:Uncharacterized protein n=1 Tax=Neobacillus kokaensis TaxID=2759023 RepID=A0ABQ3N845_9BACI|nr:hypothetical protein [Neobacillus kokaensis]GHH98680.1 hypothetical protein AM1BK_22230 [Neobacillus kokaensis]